MKRLLPVLAIFLAFAGQAQQLPLYTQYIFNPYMVNPSMVAYSGRPEINAFYRNQWSGFEDGPKTLQFDGQLPLSTKMAVGINVGSDQTVLLRTTSVLLTYGYKVQLAPEHYLGFGLSAGLFQNRIRLDQVPPSDANDPALLSTKLNNSAVDGQFGVHYNFRGLTLGFSMINLFDRKAFSPESFQAIKLSQLKNDVIFASYRAEVIPDLLAVQPNFSYRLNETTGNFYEGSLLLSIKNMVDVGGGYRQDFGPTAMVRVNIGNIQAGFAYDFPSPTAQVSMGGSQEIQLKYRFGNNEQKKKSAPATTPDVYQVPQETPKEDIKPTEPEKQPIQEPVQEKNETPVVTEPAKTEPAKTEPVVQEPVVEKKPEPVVEQKPEPVVEKPAVSGQYYLVVGTFEDRANAEKFFNSAKAKGVKVEMKESKPGVVPHYYYVYMPEHTADDISVEKVLEIQKSTGFKDAWYTKIQ